jgi:hypothetical protein
MISELGLVYFLLRMDPRKMVKVLFVSARFRSSLVRLTSRAFSSAGHVSAFIRLIARRTNCWG